MPRIETVMTAAITAEMNIAIEDYFFELFLGFLVFFASFP